MVAGLIGLSGTALAGSTYGCASGTVGGTIKRGTSPTPDHIAFHTLNLICSTPAGILTLSLDNCTVPVTFTNGAYSGADVYVTGTAAFGTGTCVDMSALFGICTANVQDIVNATFNETVKTGGWQDLILTGSGALANQSPGCGGAYTGTFNLNNIDFGVTASSGKLLPA